MASACTVVLANDATNRGIGVAGGGTFRAVRASSCVLMMVSVVGVIILVIAGVFVIREYSMSASYEPALCRVVNVTYGQRDQVCLHCSTLAAGDKASKDRSQGSTCQSVLFPCLAVLVAYVRPGDSATDPEHRALLHTDSLQAAGAHNEVGLLNV